MSSVQRYLGAEGGEQLCTLFPSLCHFPSLSRSRSLSPASLPLAFFFGYQLATFSPPTLALSLSPFLLGPPTVLRALSMSMPWLHGTAGLARQSPALPRRETSTRWRRRYLKASAITRMASWVRAEVYCAKMSRKKHETAAHRRRREANDGEI